MSTDKINLDIHKILTLLPQLPTTFGGNEQLLIQTVAGLSGWLGWVLPLLAAEWWLETRHAARALQPAAA